MKRFKTNHGEFKVSEKQYITPHYIRIFLTGDKFPLIANTIIGVNNKILIPPKNIDAIYFPEFDE